MTVPGVGSEGFKIADGYLRVYTDYKDAVKDERKFLRQSEEDFDRHHERQRHDADRDGRNTGGAFAKGFRDGLRDGLRKLVRGLRPLLAGLSFAMLGVGKLAGLGLIGGAIAVAIGGIGSAIAGLIPVITTLGKVALTAAGSLLLIPGALVTLLSLLLTAKLAFSGFGEALKAVASGDAAQLSAALKKLAPQARAVVKEIAKLKPIFDRLKLKVQNTLFANLAKILKDVGKSTLPIIGAGLTGIAGVLNGVIRDFLNFLLTAQTRADLATIFRNAARAAGNLRSALRPVLEILRDIVVVSTGVLAQLTKGLTSTFGDFAARISEMRESGELKEMILDGVAALKLLGGLLGDLLGILKGLGAAAGDAGGLFGFFDRLNKLINSKQGQTVLKQIFADLFRIGQALLPVLNALLQALLPVIDGIADIAVAFSPGLVVLALALGDALGSLAEPIAGLAPLLLAIARGLGPLAQILGDLVDAATPGLTAFIEGLVDGLQALVPVAPVVGKALGDLFRALAPIIALAGPLLADVLFAVASGLEAVVALLGPMIKLFAGALVKALVRILPVMMSFAAQVLPMIAKVGTDLAIAFAPLIPVLGQMLDVFLAQLVPHIPEVLALFSQLATLVTEAGVALAGAFLDTLQQLLPMLPELVRSGLELTRALLALIVAIAPLTPALVRFLALMIQLAEQHGALKFAVTFLIGALVLMTGFIEGVVIVVRKVIGVLTGAREAAGGFGRVVSNSIGAVVGLFRTLGATISKAVGNLGNLLFDAGKRVIQGLINGIKAMFGELRNLMGSAAQMVRDFWPFSPAKTGPLSGRGDMRYAGQHLVDRLTQGVSDRLAAAAATAAGLAGMFGPGAPAFAGSAGMTGGRSGGGKMGPYVIQIGDTAFAEMVIDTVTGVPEVVAATADEGSRKRTFQNTARRR